MNARFNRLFLVGPMGSGKSTVGSRLAGRLGLAFHDLDELLAERTGVSIAEIFEREGEAGFRLREAALLDEVTRLDGIVVATGGGCVLVPENRRWLADRGLTIYLETPVPLQLERLHRDRSRPLLQVADREARLEELVAERDPLYREVAALVVISEDVGPDTMADRIAARLGEPVPGPRRTGN